jgi:hypothetical protein
MRATMTEKMIISTSLGRFEDVTSWGQSLCEAAGGFIGHRKKDD